MKIAWPVASTTLVADGRYRRNRRLLSSSLSLFLSDVNVIDPLTQLLFRLLSLSLQLMLLLLLALAVVAPTARHRIVISVATLSKLLDQLDIFLTYRCPERIFFQQLIRAGR